MHRPAPSLLSVPAFLGVCLLSGAALAVPITVDVGDYAGRYRVDAVQATGDRVFDLGEGQHFFTTASGSSTSFTVDAAGVASVGNAVALTADGATLEVANVSVTLDPVAFAGNYQPYDAAPGTVASGVRQMVVVPGLASWIDNRSGLGGSSFAFVADGSATVTSLSPASATGSGSTLVFANATVTIDPLAYTGNYAISAFRPTFSAGERSFVLIPNLRYSVELGASLGGSALLMFVAGDGSVTAEDGAADGIGNTLSFRNVTVVIEPGSFTGSYRLSSHVGEGYTAGAKTRVLVPDIRYSVGFDSIGGASIVDTLDANGHWLGESPLSSQVQGGTLSFLTETVHFAPDGPAAYRVGVGTSVSGEQSLALVPNLNWQVVVNGNSRLFALSTPCAVDPTQISPGGLNLVLSCGSPDADEDGVPDAGDNCPAVANADQLDLDADGLGDACDADLDGDGVENDADVCPDVYDDQADSDGDGVGDVCDEDGDGDLVEDDSDNCPTVANPDQANADGDARGDACDDDDDDDGVFDEFDNCPLLFNADQTDSDGDGQGNACDGDDDGDFVADADDLCPGSPADLPIDASGCSGLQRVALRCPEDAFINHGQYVSCVAHEANLAEQEGLLTKKEKARIISAAGRK